MDDTISLSQEAKHMDLPLGHPYAQYRKCQSTSTLPLAAHFPPVPALPIKHLRLGSWDSDSSMASDKGPVTTFLSLTGLPSDKDKPDILPPTVAPHGCPYVKHASGITVILSGHKAGTSLPLYPSGSSISGVVVLSKLESVESLEVKVSDPLISPACTSSSSLRHSWKDPSLYAKSRRA
jgi:hypothetical protein